MDNKNLGKSQTLLKSSRALIIISIFFVLIASVGVFLYQENRLNKLKAKNEDIQAKLDEYNELAEEKAKEPSITLLNPKNGEELCLGKTYQIQWESKDVMVVKAFINNISQGKSAWLDSTNMQKDSSAGFLNWKVGYYKGILFAKSGDIFKIGVQDAESNVSSVSDNIVVKICK